MQSTKTKVETRDAQRLIPTSSVAVLHVGEVSTSLCDSGDFMPTYPQEAPITEDLLSEFFSQTDGGEDFPAGPAVSKNAVNEATGDGLLEWRTLAARLYAPMRGRDVIVILPLSSSATFQSRLAVYLFSQWIGVASAVFLSDVLADSIACGAIAVSSLASGADQGEGMLGSGPAGCPSSGSIPPLVVHASLRHVTLARVRDGSSVKYSVSKAGSLHALCQSAKPSSGGTLSAGAGAAVTPAKEARYAPLLSLNLQDPQYRSELIAAFGYRPYVRACAKMERRAELTIGSPAERSHREERRSGEGNGGKRARTSDVSSSEQNAWKLTYSRKQRSYPGSLEKLLARVAGAASTSPKSAVPTIIAGEALRVPFMSLLLKEIVRRCGDERITQVVEAEARAKARRLKQEARKRERGEQELAKLQRLKDDESEAAQSVANSGANAAGAKGKRTRDSGNGGKKERVASPSAKRPKNGNQNDSADSESDSNGEESKKADLEDEESSEDTDEAESSDTSSSSSATSSSSESEDTSQEESEPYAFSDTDEDGDSAGESEDDNCLVEQPQPLPDAPWLLALLGGSIVSELTLGELAKMRVTAEEVKSSKGSIVLWKAML